MEWKACCYSLLVLCIVLLLSNVLSEACTACQSKKWEGTNLKFRYDKERSRVISDLVIFHELWPLSLMYKHGRPPSNISLSPDAPATKLPASHLQPATFPFATSPPVVGTSRPYEWHCRSPHCTTLAGRLLQVMPIVFLPASMVAIAVDKVVLDPCVICL